jgi:lipoate-protein ligase A
MIGGRKLLGSAQKRTTSAVLQHGSIPVGPVFRRLPAYLNLSHEMRSRYADSLKTKCACVNEIAPQLTIERLTECVEEGFRRELGRACE